MRDSRAPGSRSRRGSHARPTGIAGRISISVPTARRPALASARTLRRRLADVARWEPAPLRRIPRPRSIRAKVVCLLAIPIVSLMTLWGLLTVQVTQSVYALTELRQLNAAVHAPADNLVSALQRERIGVARFLGGPAAGTPDATLTAAYTATDTASAALRTGAGESAAAATGLGTDVGGPLSTLLGDLSALPALRGEAAKRQVTWDTAAAGYAKAIEDALALEGGLAAVLDRTGQSGAAASDAWSVVELARSREMLARQAAIVANAQVAGGGLSADGFRQFAGAYYSQYELEQAALPQLRDADASAYRQVTSSPNFQQLRAAQQQLLDGGDQAASAPNVAAAEGTFGALAPTALDDVGHVVTAAGTAAIAQIDPYGHALATKAGVGVLLGLIALVACLLMSVWVGRGLVLELTGLRDSALDLARRRLPRAIARLRAGEKVSVEAEVQAAALLGAASSPEGAPAGLAHGGHDGSGEIGQVVQALATVHQAALRAALDRAEAVSGVSGVFLNLARRSQVLLHRQLALLDLMERRIDDARDLEDLFRLDHLATRMRRHAEGLIILSGAAPGRGWRRPAPLMDVVRAAVAEVEDFARVDVRRMPDVHVAGAAIADLTHLFAELVENATVFSPPHTRVQVHGSLVAAGYALEIEDRGLGMSAEAMTEANRRIDSARQDDLFDSDRLGLFVVSRLARRHGVRVALQHSAYGGMVAVVLLPPAVLDTAALTTASMHAAALEPAAMAAADARPSRNASPAPERRRPAAARQEPVLVAAGSSAQPTSAPDEPEPRPDLPRRVRQANLAPGLRDERDPPPPAEPERTAATRTPEQARATMSAYQHGWSQGRAAAGSPAPDA